MLQGTPSSRPKRPHRCNLRSGLVVTSVMCQTAAELETVAALRRGDHLAFTSLVRAHQPAFLRLAHTWVGDATAAGEVVQQAWLSALESLSTFQGKSSLRTWLFGIVINSARSHVRARKRLVSLSALL